MEEDNKDIEKTSKKARIKRETDDELERQLEDLKERLAKLEEQEQEEDEPKAEEEYIDYTSRDNKTRFPLADSKQYPSKEEKALLEDKVNERKDFTLQETSKDTSFWGKVFKKNKVKGDSKVAVMLLHPNTEATVHYMETEKDGSFKIQEEQYHVNEHCVYNLKIKKDRYPLCILPTWSMIPIGTKAWFELSQERRGHELERIILNAIKKEEIIKSEDPKKKSAMSGKTLWIIIGIIVIGYFIMKSGAIKF